MFSPYKPISTGRDIVAIEAPKLIISGNRNRKISIGIIHYAHKKRNVLSWHKGSAKKHSGERKAIKKYKMI